MGKRDYFSLGDYNFICDRCGAKFKASEGVMESQDIRVKPNLFVCRWCKDKLNPQSLVRGVKDDQRAPTVRARGAIQFITTDVTPEDL